MNKFIMMKAKKWSKWVWVKAKNNPMYSIPLVLIVAYFIWKQFMANYTGANVITASDVTKYQPDAFGFGIASTDTEAVNFFAQTTNDILRQLRVEWWQTYKTNVFTDITVLNTAEMVDTKVNLDQFERAGVYLFLGRFLCPALTKFRHETEKDRFERMGEFYMSEYNKEWRTILEDGVEYDETGDGTIQVSEREPLHGFRRLTR